MLSLLSCVELCRYTEVSHSSAWSSRGVLVVSAYYKESLTFVWPRLWTLLGTYVGVLWLNHFGVLRLCQMSSEEVVRFLLPPAVWERPLLIHTLSRVKVFSFSCFPDCDLICIPPLPPWGWVPFDASGPWIFLREASVQTSVPGFNRFLVFLSSESFTNTLNISLYQIPHPLQLRLLWEI